MNAQLQDGRNGRTHLPYRARADSTQPCVADRVRLTHDVPQHDLHRGEVGIIQSIWLLPDVAFDVEFVRQGEDQSIRALLTPPQVELLDVIERDGIEPEA